MVKHSLRIVNSGLTLIELMIALAVLLIVVTVGIPSASTLVANNQMIATTNDLVTHLQYARSEAIKRKMRVSACSSSDGLVCANSIEWGVGWIVFTDDSGASGSLDESDQLLRSYHPTGMAVSIASDRAYVSYQSSGAVSM